MSSRAQAALQNLQLRLLESLPFLQQLQAPKPLLEIILDDFHKHQAVETTEKLVNTQISKDTKQGYAPGQESPETKELRGKLASIQKESRQAEEEVEKAIDKHYRVSSKSLHPDRHGESSRQAFENLVKARELLKQAQKRRLYLEQMMQVAQISPSLIQKSHEAWIQRNVISDSQQQQQSSSTTKKPFLIKGGIANDIPRKPYVSLASLKKRRLDIELPVKHNFGRYCLQIHVEGTCADYQGDNAYSIATLNKHQVEKALLNESNSVEISAALPVSGIWDIYWFATLDINGQQVNTPHSHEARVDLTSEEQLRRRALIQSTNELAKQRAGDVQQTIAKLRGPRPDHLEIERRCDLLHQVVARGRSTLNRLLDLLRADGVSESSVNGLEPLRKALDLAGPAKEQLEAQFALSSKKDSLKSFKHHVAALLESGDAASWLRSLDDANLKSLGGEPNRLYQLLVEGKVAHHLELDAATLEAAAERHDLFTPKQCEALAARHEQVEQHVQEEAERAMQQAKEEKIQESKEAAELQMLQQKQAEEKKKRQLLEARYEAEQQAQLAAIRESQEMAKGMVVEHPVLSLVEIHGLITPDGKPLNGTIGTIMYKKEQRFVVQCEIDGKLRAFLPENLKNLGVLSNEYSNPTTNNGNGWSCDMCTYYHEGDRSNATVCDICDSPRNGNSASPATTASPTTSVPLANTAVVSTSATKQTNATKQQAVPVESKPKAIVHKNTKGDTSTQPCFHGKNCRYIKNGKNDCKFYHSPEEIEQALAMAKGDHQIYIPDKSVGWVIGKHGAHMKEVQRKSRAKVSIDQKQMYPNKTRVIRITGSQDQIDMAVKMVKDLVNQYDGGHGKSPPRPAKSTDTNGGAAAPVARVPVNSPPQPVQQQQPPPPQPKVVKPPSVVSPPKAAVSAPPPPPVPKSVQKPLETASQNERAVTPSPRPSSKLLAFLQEENGCLKGSPEAFSAFLATEDIVSLEDLAAAVLDDDYLHETLQQGNGKVGVKGFKRAAFKKAVLGAVDHNMNGNATNGHRNDDEAPAELICPISHVLMVNDPVIAADGYTYERAAIDAWFRKQQKEMLTAKQQISGGNDSQQARAIIERGVLSPMTHSTIPNLNLTPNLNVRNLARDFATGH